MIINLLRVKPKVFLTQMEHLKSKCDKRQRTKNIIFLPTDVEASINVLSTSPQMKPLEISGDLCQVCKEQFALYHKFSVESDQLGMGKQQRRDFRQTQLTKIAK